MPIRALNSLRAIASGRIYLVYNLALQQVKLKQSNEDVLVRYFFFLMGAHIRRLF
jgi:hypothetical protein